MNNLEIKNQNGRSMIEMLGVLAIIGVLSVGGIAGYSKAMQKYRINKTIEQITLIAGNIRAFWGPQKNYEGVSCYCSNGSCYGQSGRDGCPILKKAKIFPDEMVELDSDGKLTDIKNIWGNGIEVATDIAPDEKAFWIMSSYPPDACIELISHDWRNANIEYIFTDRTNHTSGTEIKSFDNFPISIDDAAEYCTTDDGYEVLVDFVFK